MSEQLALDGGTPVRTAAFPRPQPIPPATDDAPVEAFERELSAFVGAGVAAVAVASYRDAVALACRALGMDEGEVVVPAVGAGGLVRALLAAGLVPVPAEVDSETANLSARGLAGALGPRTRALAVTHAFGHPAPMRELLPLAERRALAVLEDVSAALGGGVGTGFGGRAAGSLGEAAVLAFSPGHLLTGGAEEGAGQTGRGGVVLLADEPMAERARRWREGRGAQPAEDVVRVALAELRHAPERLQMRREAAWHLTYELRGVRGIAAMSHGRWVRHGYDRYVLRLRSMLWHRPLSATVEALRAEGIPCALALSPPLHEDDEVRRALGAGDPRLLPERFLAATQLARELLAVPLDGAPTTRDIDDVAEALRKLARASTQPVGAGGSGER